MKLAEKIQQIIKQKGDMPFVDYMQHALYEPRLGYYSSNLPKLGAQGDFITAPELTCLFGKTVANQILQIKEAILSEDEFILFEFGAGSGKLCVDVLTHLETLNGLPDAYHILEVSENLHHRQRAYIKEKIPHLFDKVHWLTSWPSKPFQGVILANEVLDAMPVHRFTQTEDALLECYITTNEKEELVETYKPCINPRLLNYLEKALPKHLGPYQSEANLFVEQWIKQVYDMLSTGAFLIFDYGFPRHEYYHSDRSMGTLMCHHQHRAHSNPLAHPGEEDITAHVDFTQVAEAGSLAGFHVAGFVNQATFLLMNGILSFLESYDPHVLGKEEIIEKQAVKKLLQADEMGELFKVMALTKQINIPLNGFQLHDKRASL